VAANNLSANPMPNVAIGSPQCHRRSPVRSADRLTALPPTCRPQTAPCHCDRSRRSISRDLFIIIRSHTQHARAGLPIAEIPRRAARHRIAGDPGVPNGIVKTDYTAVMPRVGFALDPTGKGLWSIRAASGIFYTIHSRIARTWPFWALAGEAGAGSTPVHIQF